MVRNNTFFLISGFISVSLFSLFSYVFINMLFSSKKNNVFALKKDNYISISLDSSLLNVKSFKKNLKPSPKVLKSVSSPSPSPEVDIGNLFNDVWTKKIDKKPHKKRKVDNKRFQEIQKRVKTLKNKDVKNISEIVKNIDMTSNKSEKSSPSTSNEVNEYLAKIQALVYNYFNPPPNSQGNSVKAVIELSAIGKVIDFRILNYSTNSALNDECDRLKSRLENVLFPVNPKHESGNYIIILTSKE